MRTGIEHEVKEVEAKTDDVCRALSFRSPHVRLTQVSLQDGTDGHNELVQEREWLLHPREGLALAGNLFLVEELAEGRGTILIKRAPLPHARPGVTGTDVRVRNRRGMGFDIHLLPDEGAGTEDPWVVLEYAGGRRERTRRLHEWQAAQRPSTPAHTCPRFLSNTWGDRSRDACVRHVFMTGEIEAAAKLGVDVVQIDDGWQKGISQNSAYAKERGGIWDGFWDADPEFWTPHPERFPHGLEPLVRQAKGRGMGMGLWFVPDRTRDYANWRRDAECILGLHNRLAVEHFKIDGVRAESAAAFANLTRFIRTVLEESRGAVVMDLDITAGIRPGYFGEIACGPLYVENRYTDWHGYWPHLTLRNLWKLARWIDPRRLRFEFLNNTRNLAPYAHDPLAPGCYDPATLFATVMFANPLGWFEVSNLPDGWIESVAPLVKTWRDHREDLFSGTIMPVGAAPDGYAPSGFVSLAQDGRSGYALLFRERHPSAEFAVRAPGVECSTEWALLAGEGAIKSDDGRICATVQKELGFVFARFF